ncbi:ABC transporter substrate-binding protein [Bradyrhizobium commune]|uniref:ABC transporter substrate-binding protein n=1 Tax=Bradyrhizobium commune TaxID=83627 RepID=A0A7S9DC15_9BRAD|nr:ABC transporter substrate-binding protein [Bradyrhizobium commune]QPF95031.1 ABC transporter substrate-binding protein [Bradyrhizobium commune]
MSRLRLVCGVLSLVLSGPVLAADLSSVSLIEKGALTYGVAGTFSPFEFQKDGKLSGFDIDMIGLLTKKLGVEAKPMNMEFKGLIVALQGGRLDLINSAMYINEQRAGQVDFVPYLKIGTLVVVQASNPAKITGRDESLCGKTIAVTLGGIQESYARQDDQRCRDKGLAAVNVMTLPTAQDSALTLRQGRADVVFNSTPGVVELMDKVPGVYAVAGSEFEANTQIGIAVRKGDTAMKSAVEAALKEIVADGSYKKLIETWKFPASVSLFD